MPCTLVECLIWNPQAAMNMDSYLPNGIKSHRQQYSGTTVCTSKLEALYDKTLLYLCSVPELSAVVLPSHKAEQYGHGHNEWTSDFPELHLPPAVLTSDSFQAILSEVGLLMDGYFLRHPVRMLCTVAPCSAPWRCQQSKTRTRNNI